MAKPIPDISVPVIGSDGHMTLEWYRYFQGREKVGLSDLVDVKITSLTGSQYLAWNATDKKYENVSLPAPATVSIATCTDVHLTSIAAGQGLFWNAGTSKFENQAPTLSGLSDVNLTALADLEVLIWTAADSKWENGAN